MKKTFKIGFPNHPKINEKPLPDRFVSILLLRWSSMVVPRCQNGTSPKVLPRYQNASQCVKMEAPMAATAYKLTASNPCTLLPATCYPQGSAVSLPWAYSLKLRTRSCQAWQQLLLPLPWQKLTYAQVSLKLSLFAQPARLPTIPPASCGPPGCEGMSCNI